MTKKEYESMSLEGLCFHLQSLLVPSAPEVYLPVYLEEDDKQLCISFDVTEEEDDPEARKRELDLIQTVLYEHPECKRMIRSQVAKYRSAIKSRGSVDEEDLCQVAAMAVERAAEAYRDIFNCPFIAYATRVVHNQIYGEWTEKSGDARVPASTYAYGRNQAAKRKTHEELWRGMSLDAQFADAREGSISPAETLLAAQGSIIPSAESLVMENYTEAAKKRAMSTLQKVLTKKQLQLLWAHEVRGVSYEELGQQYGITRQSVCKTVKRAKDALLRNADFCQACQEAGIGFGT